MAIQDQLANAPLAYDEVFFNYSASVDIAAGVVVVLDQTNYVGDGSGHTVPGVVIAPTTLGTAYPVGVSMETIKAGSSGRVRTIGIVVVTNDANASITPGVPLIPSTSVAGAVRADPIATSAKPIGFARSGGAASDPIIMFVAAGVNVA